jgi:protein-S-isoprenylcysteine O-methyltransferase Ste14
VRRGVAAAGSTLFFALAPGSVALLLPWLLTGWHVGALPWWVRAPGVLPILAGLLVIVPAFARFVTEGSGTPSPTAPTDRLVVGGLYRYLRNPMYVAVLLAIAGQALLLGRGILVVYWLCAAAAMVSFVLAYEQPYLASRYGASYAEYRRHVPGWFPRRHPWNPPS